MSPQSACPPRQPHGCERCRPGTLARGLKLTQSASVSPLSPTVGLHWVEVDGAMSALSTVVGHRDYLVGHRAHTGIRLQGSSRSASMARSAQLILARASSWRSSTASWWRSSKISTDFQDSERRDSRSHPSSLCHEESSPFHRAGDVLVDPIEVDLGPRCGDTAPPRSPPAPETPRQRLAARNIRRSRALVTRSRRAHMKTSGVAPTSRTWSWRNAPPNHQQLGCVESGFGATVSRITYARDRSDAVGGPDVHLRGRPRLANRRAV